MYLLLADESMEGFQTWDEWDPRLYEYQQRGANVLFFSFISPGDCYLIPFDQFLFLKMGQSWPLFNYFCSFLITISIIQIEKA